MARHTCPTCDEVFSGGDEDIPEAFVDDVDRLADLIASGETAEAYALLRDHFDGLPDLASRQRLLAARRMPHAGAVPDADTIEARHREAVARLFPQKDKRIART